MPKVLIPTPLRQYAGKNNVVELNGAGIPLVEQIARFDERGDARTHDRPLTAQT